MRILDLFCGAGGASVGYHRVFPDAQIVGVDLAPQPDYPFRFIQGDATAPPVVLDAFDLIHASPPCQHFTRYRNNVKDIATRYSDHLAETQALLAGRRYVIENVPGAPLRTDVELCGSMFGLDVRRHRVFELGGFEVPLVPPHNHLLPRRFKPSTGRENLRRTIEIGAWNEPLRLQQQAMDMPWVSQVRQLSEAIPPAYTEYIASHL
jgi:DNA (cytosine-5)-methyltransferase 1